MACESADWCRRVSVFVALTFDTSSNRPPKPPSKPEMEESISGLKRSQDVSRAGSLGSWNVPFGAGSLALHQDLNGVPNTTLPTGYDSIRATADSSGSLMTSPRSSIRSLAIRSSARPAGGRTFSRRFS